MNAMDCPAGQVTLARGDVVVLSGAKCIVSMVNECRAMVLPMNTKYVSLETRFGDKVQFTRLNRAQNISPNIEKEMLEARTGEQGLKDFLASKGTRREGGGEVFQTTTETNTKEDGMGSKLRKLKGEPQKRRARGGLAAEALADAKPRRRARAATPTAEANGNGKHEGAGNTKGRLGSLFGFSVVRCIIAAAKKGATFEQIDAVLKKHEIKAKESTVRGNISLGKRRKLEGAPLSAEQFAVFGV